MLWAGLVEFFYDYPHSRRIRRRSLEIATLTAETVKGPGILFTTEPFPFLRLIERDRLRIADPRQDNFRSFPELLTFHLNNGHSVYAAFEAEEWRRIRNNSILNAFIFKVLPRGFFSGIVCQIVKQPSS